MEWFALRQGQGPPLILLHGIGDRAQTWEPVLPLLARERDVIALDLPGFGQTPPLTDRTPTPAAFAALLPEALRHVGVDLPVAIAGNSLGGWTALEAARLGHTSSVVALDPAGMWGAEGSWWGRRSVRVLHAAATGVSPRTARVLASTPAGRAVLLGLVCGRPWRVPARVAAESVRTMADAPGFQAVVDAIKTDHFHGGREITVPVTVAFGTRDWILRRDSRRRDELPSDHRWVTLPGCGHVPMWDDPELVARVILDGTRET